MRYWPIALLLIATTALAEPATRPSKLAAYADLAALAAKYDQLLSGNHWKTVFNDDFHASATRTWMQLDRASGQPVPAAVSYVNVDGAEVLVFDARKSVVGLLVIGPKVHGDFAIEFEGRTVGDHACDLSIVCDRIGHGPAFQFGGHDNTGNSLWAPRDAVPNAGASAGSFSENEIEASRLIQLGKWTLVRLEIHANAVTGIVDGNVIGSVPFKPGAIDPGQDFQPLIYVYNNPVALRMVKVQEYDPEVGGATADQAWKQVFGNTTHEQVKARVDEIVALLDDDDDRVRDGASDLLAHLGSIAIPSLQAVCHSGFPEQERRAATLLMALGATIPK